MHARLISRVNGQAISKRDIIHSAASRGLVVGPLALSGATGSAELIEGNNWNDTFWGVCRGRGRNMLGQLLMEIRDEIRAAGD